MGRGRGEKGEGKRGGGGEEGGGGGAGRRDTHMHVIMSPCKYHVRA